MNGRHRCVRKIAARVPAGLRALRGRALLDEYVGHMGLEEVECPACGGTGFIAERSMEYCPICLGFEEVPGSLAAWFEEELGREADVGAGRFCSRSPAEPAGTRYGRCAEHIMHVCLEGLTTGFHSVLSRARR